MIHYQKITGTYYTSSAFALHYALDLLSGSSDKKKTVLVCNNLITENLGLILVSVQSDLNEAIK